MQQFVTNLLRIRVKGWYNMGIKRLNTKYKIRLNSNFFKKYSSLRDRNTLKISYTKHRNTGGGVNMNNFHDFLKQNKDKIRRTVSKNTIVNSNGAVVIPRNDTWRKETEWDIMYEELKK